MRFFAGIMLVMLLAGMGLAQDSTQALASEGILLPGLSARLTAGMSPDNLTAALKPIEVAGKSVVGIGFYLATVPLNGGSYLLNMGTKSSKLIVIALSPIDSANTNAGDALSSWFDAQVAALPSPAHATDKDSKGNPRESWTANEIRWSKSMVATKEKTVPLYTVEFLALEKD